MNITDINPFLYDLLFERFLNPARVSMPDFDIDFEDTLRDKVVNYVTEKYGRDKVSSIGTYMKLATKAAFKDVARAMGIPFDKANIVVGLMDEDMSLKDMTIDNTAINEDMRNMLTNDTVVAKAIEQAGQIE
jgi:DNA polymerase-3 subunit alpha